MKYPPLFATTREKLGAIDCALKNCDLVLLQHFCTSRFGLVSDQMRKKVWPLLIGLTDDSDNPSATPLSALRTKYAHQIEVDIARSLLSFDLVRGMSEDARKVRAAQLTRAITRIVSEDPELHYFQGFHDICTVFLLVAGEELGYRLIRKFVYTRCRDAMRPTFNQISSLMMLIVELLHETDAELGEKLVSLQQEMPMFALSWVLTYFSHDIARFDIVARVFDFCLAAHPLAIIYLSTALIRAEKADVMIMTDMPELHGHFAKALQRTDWDALCEDAQEMMRQVPPKRLVKLLNSELPSDSPISEKSYWLFTVMRRTAVLATSIGSLLAFTYMRQYGV